jgi:hypothetical protein
MYGKPAFFATERVTVKSMDALDQGRYRIILTCDGVPAAAGPQAAVDITEEFTHRPWHENVECRWNGESLLLTAENDFDTQGLALIDEFSDAIAACIANGFDGRIRVVSITAI